MATVKMIDHPLLEVLRVFDSGMLSDPFLARVRAEYHSGPPTAARLRAALFETMGPDWVGRVPVALEESVEVGPDDWMVYGCIDDESVVRLADGSTFLNATLPASRRMVAWTIDPAIGADLRDDLAAGKHPVLNPHPVDCIDLGQEEDARRSLAEFMASDDAAGAA
jgi:hypothetical protein